MKRKTETHKNLRNAELVQSEGKKIQKTAQHSYHS